MRGTAVLVGCLVAFAGCGDREKAGSVVPVPTATPGGNNLGQQVPQRVNIDDVISDPQTGGGEPVSGHVGSYEYIRLLGRGATSDVFLVSRGPNELFALKKARRNLFDVRELEALTAVLGHRGFPQLIEFFEDDQFVYLVSTLVGESIERIRTPGGKLITLPDFTVGSIGLQLLDRLETLHSVGFVHMDAYPNNIAVGLGREGATELFLIDFGEARAGGSRLLDIQSLSHTVLQLMRPGTPYGDYKHYQDSGVSIEEMCTGLAPAVQALFEYSHRALSVSTEDVDYDFVRGILRQLAPHYSGNLLW